MLHGTLVLAAGLGTLALARWYGRRGAGQWVTWVALAWAIVVSYAIQRVLQEAYLVQWREGRGPPLTVAAWGTLLVLAYLYCGLVRLWPGSSHLGFGRANAARSLAVGAAVGALLATMGPGVWTSVARTPPSYWLYFVSANQVSSVVLEEAVCRGRAMELFLLQSRSFHVANLGQALVYTVAHACGMLLSEHQRWPGFTAAASPLAVIFVVGYAFGLVRQQTGNLWGPAGAHMVYNALVWFHVPGA